MAGEDEEEGSRDRGERGERESEEKAGTWAGRGGKDGDRGTSAGKERLLHFLKP